jgi:hypothetical protein
MRGYERALLALLLILNTTTIVLLLLHIAGSLDFPARNSVTYGFAIVIVAVSFMVGGLTLALSVNALNGRVRALEERFR